MLGFFCGLGLYCFDMLEGSFTRTIPILRSWIHVKEFHQFVLQGRTLFWLHMHLFAFLHTKSFWNGSVPNLFSEGRQIILTVFLAWKYFQSIKYQLDISTPSHYWPRIWKKVSFYYLLVRLKAAYILTRLVRYNAGYFNLFQTFFLSFRE